MYTAANVLARGDRPKTRAPEFKHERRDLLIDLRALPVMLDLYDRMTICARIRLRAGLSRELIHLLVGDPAAIVVAEQDEVDRLFVDPRVLDLRVAPERDPCLSLVPECALLALARHKSNHRSGSRPRSCRSDVEGIMNLLAESAEPDDEQFPPPVRPSGLIIGEGYPATREFLDRHLDMQIADLRLLFRLPVEELDPGVGCNFTVAAMMLNLISGFSVWFFHTDDAARIRAEEERRGLRLSGQRFKGFVREYWPRIEPEPAPEEVARRLYDVRNSLAHSLGVNEDPCDNNPSNVSLAKPVGLSLDDVVMRLERNLLHPLSVPIVEGNEREYTLHLAGLYWALHHMLKTALRDRPGEIERAVAAVTFPEIGRVTDSPPS